MTTASLVRPIDPITHRFMKMPKQEAPTRVYHLEFPGCTIVDRGIQKQLKEGKDYDPAQSREFVFEDSYYQAMTPEDLEAVLRCGGSSVAVEDLPEGLEASCPFCGRESRCRKWMAVHITRCSERD